MSTLLTRAVITVSGSALGCIAGLGIRALMRARTQHGRSHRDGDDVRRVTVSPDGEVATVINLDAYRHRRCQHDDPDTDDVDDGPA